MSALFDLRVAVLALALGACSKGAALDDAGNMLVDGATSSPGDGPIVTGGPVFGDPVDLAIPGPHALVRVADFSKPKLLRLDFCFSTDPISATTHWVGPMLRGQYTWIQTGAISAYVGAPAGAQSLRFVLASSTDCTGTLAGVADLPLATPLAESTRSTIVFNGTAFGAGSRALQVTQYLDESLSATGPNSVRFINAAQTPTALDIYGFSGFGSKLPCTLLYDNIAFGAFGTPMNLAGAGAPDANGYAALTGKNLHDLTMAMTLGFSTHGMGCGAAFGSFYGTDNDFSTGAWTVFVVDDPSYVLLCRDDGSATPLCVAH